MESNETTEIQVGAIYEHYKGKRYKVHGVAVHSESLTKLVVYECLYENEMSDLWVRPLEMFQSTIEIEGKTIPRFKKI